MSHWISVSGSWFEFIFVYIYSEWQNLSVFCFLFFSGTTYNFCCDLVQKHVLISDMRSTLHAHCTHSIRLNMAIFRILYGMWKQHFLFGYSKLASLWMLPCTVKTCLIFPYYSGFRSVLHTCIQRIRNMHLHWGFPAVPDAHLACSYASWGVLLSILSFSEYFVPVNGGNVTGESKLGAKTI